MQKKFVIIILLVTCVSRFAQKSNLIKTIAATLATTTKLSIEENAFAQKLLNAFINKDEQEYLLIHPTNEEYVALLQEMLKTQTQNLTSEKINEMTAEQREEGTTFYPQEWNRLLRSADSLNVNWKEATLSKFMFDTTHAMSHCKYLNGDLWFNVHEQEFVIEGIEAVETTSGCKLQAIKDLQRTDENE